MSSKTAEPAGRTAAIRLTLWSAVAFAIGTAIVFLFLHSFVANEIQGRSDAWLNGEVAVLGELAEEPQEKNAKDTLVAEVAELASREAPRLPDSKYGTDRAVFFVECSPAGTLLLHTGAGEGTSEITAIRSAALRNGVPASVQVPGFHVPFRVSMRVLPNGNQVYLALSTRYERTVLHRLRRKFTLLWCGISVLGALIVFVSTRRMLRRVQAISETAAQIGHANLSSRVPVTGRRDEIVQLTRTFNQMLDRIQTTVQQLHTMSDSLAHDLRSPLTSIRAKLELALMTSEAGAKEEAIVHSIEELDRMSSLLSTSLDIAEANAGALRLRREPVDLESTVRSLVELYDPSFAEAGLQTRFQTAGPIMVQVDSALLQRALTNLFDNELEHLSPGATVTISVRPAATGGAIAIEDDGPGFPEEILPRVFERYVKGEQSRGHGLGLAFVAAVVSSHEGAITACNTPSGGASIELQFP